ncbi:MAG: hypothetical protein A3F90_11120 [Deltaproteobacteria bacterium RIFCSPLOWO2_12_FULL_60_19]|nr:MAG: hypothetical protein A3F90_11120 [Deltaproteobacteria bacterium RIFCSPLOWO2_12_FULL_60_19]
MTDLSVLRELLIVLAAILFIVFVSQKLRLPAIIGFLLAGVVMGPHGLKVIRDAAQVETLAEIGVALLLFTIGLEFSLGRFVSASRALILAGALQILLTTGVVWALSIVFGYPTETGIFYGFLVSLSSTAIVLRIYKDRGESDALSGRVATGVLLLQDLCIVPMMLSVPLLGQAGTVSAPLVAWAMGQALLALLLIAFGARKVFPWLLRQIALLRNRELFVLFVVFICLGTAWLTSEVGLSLALGAFIAGLVISDSELSHQVIAEVLPLRDSFSGIFFISIGMLLRLDNLLADGLAALGIFAVIALLKGLIVLLVIARLYQSMRLAVVVGLSLAQVGEFSFLLARAGRDYGLMTSTEEQIFLAASILSMFATPFLIQSAHALGFGLQKMIGQSTAEADAEPRAESGHVLIVGYGLNGQNLARVLKEVGILYTILEMDAALVRDAKAAGEPIAFGDGTRPEVLAKAGIAEARVLVVAISDPIATARVVSQARSMRGDLYIIVRTRYVAEIDRLYRLGANQVIPEEFETSVEIFARVLQEYHLPRNLIALQVDLIRKEHYGALRGLRLEGRQLDELSRYLVGTTTDTVLVLESSPAAARTLEQIELRSRSGVTVIAVVRDGKSIPAPPPDFRLATNDILVLLGSHQALGEAAQILSPRLQD